MDKEARSIKSFLASSHNIHVVDSWLEICIAWCKEVLLTPDYTPEQLQRNVYEQWLLIDLRDLERPCLPPKLSSREDFTLNGNFFLQVMELVDISKPKLWQLQRIRNERVLTKGTQQESDITVATGKRKLQLTLSDGVQEVEAIEYSPIPSLSINLLPGAKLWVLGPVVVSRGRLMLERQNVKVLGGDVLKLRVSNHPENVLARSLKLPENPKPGKIDEKVLYGEADKEEAIMTVCDVNEPKPFTNNHLPPNRLPDSKTQLLNCSSNDRLKRPYQSSIVPTASYVMTDEQEQLCTKLNRILRDARNTKYPPPKKTKTQDFDEHVTSTQTNSTEPPKENKFVPQNVDDDYVFNDMDIDAHPDKIEPPAPEKPPDHKILSPEKPPIFAISKFLEKRIDGANFKITVKFESTVDKLKMTKDDSKLISKIEDDTSDFFDKLDQFVTSTRANPTKPPEENNFVSQNFDDVFDLRAHLDKFEKQSQHQKPPSPEKPPDRKIQSPEKLPKYNTPP